MSELRGVNPHQPQTLYLAVILCYIDAVFGLLQGGGFFLITLLLAGGGFGVANEKKWGYALAVVGAVAQVLALFAYNGIGALNNFWTLLSFLFDTVLVVLLLHPMSRDYQRIWFK
ncbi:MAG TPA: hypothetical protein VFR41_10585 [Acidimicrobiia bacterium]|nr:hypothetical protein [Acidimicrobiia bacterium]